MSLKDAWHSATTSTTDVKELIPEFFMPGKADRDAKASSLSGNYCSFGPLIAVAVLPPTAGGY